MKKILFLLFAALLVALALRFLPAGAPESEEKTTEIGEVTSAPSAPAAVDAELPAPAAELLRAPVAETSSQGEIAALPEPKDEVIGQEVWVRTVDEAGRPVSGIPVGFGWSAERAHSETLGVTAAPDALARIRIPPPQPDRDRFVHALLLGPSAASAPVPDAIDFDRPIDVVLPAHGAVRVEVEEAISMYTQCVLDRADEQPVDPRFGHREGGLWSEVREGVVDYPCVALGQPLLVTLRQQHGSSAIERAVAGPTRAGEVVIVRMSAGSEPALVGRLLEPSGEPLAAAVCSIKLLSEGSNAGRMLTTGNDGRFRIELDAQSVQGMMKEMTLRLDRPNPQQGWGSGSFVTDLSRRVRITLPAQIEAGAYDLGDLRLEAAPVLVAGRVSNRSGEPVAGVNLHVQQALFVHANGESTYGELDEASAISTEDGSFTVFGDPPDAALQLVAHERSYLSPPPVPFLAGDPNLQLIVHRAGAIEGSVIFPVGLQRLGITIALDPAAPGQRAELSVSPNLDGRGTFRFSTLTPGEYELRFQIGRKHSPFHVVSGIVVTEGDPQRDPRLTEVDIASYLSLATIRLRTSDGSPLPDMVMVHTFDGEGNGVHGTGVPPTDGVVSVLCRPEAPADLAITAKGFQNVFLPALRGDLEVVLTPVFQVVLRVANEKALDTPHGKCFLQVNWRVPPGVPTLLPTLRGAAERTLRLAGREGNLTVAYPCEVEFRWNVPRGDGSWTTREGAIVTLHGGDAGRVIELPSPLLD